MFDGHVRQPLTTEGVAKDPKRKRRTTKVRRGETEERTGGVLRPLGVAVEGGKDATESESGGQGQGQGPPLAPASSKGARQRSQEASRGRRGTSLGSWAGGSPCNYTSWRPGTGLLLGHHRGVLLWGEDEDRRRCHQAGDGGRRGQREAESDRDRSRRAPEDQFCSPTAAVSVPSMRSRMQQDGCRRVQGACSEGAAGRPQTKKAG